MLNRTEAPEVHALTSFPLIKAQTVKLANGLPLHFIRNGSQEVVKIELVYNAGNYYEPSAGLAFLATKMLNEGTKNHTAKALAEKIAYYGASLELYPGNDKISISMVSLTKHLPFLLPLLNEILKDSIFPEENFDNLKNIQSQQLLINLEKTSYQASGLFKKNIFGENHPYGYFLDVETIEKITYADTLAYYNGKIRENSFEIIASGMVTDAVIKDIDRIFGAEKMKFPTSITIKKEARGSGKNKITWSKEDNSQCSIRIGRKLFTKNHPDYIKFLVLCEILGGYFGSRLMKNIREEKGLTYGIYAQSVSMVNEGFFIIGTDVKKELVAQALEEIYKEIEKLKNELVNQEELDTVRNYMLGTYISSLNTPFQLAEKFKSIHYSGLDYEFYTKYTETIKKITASELQQLAEKYFDSTSLIEVVAG
ncbi:MAG: M16 family metallopeptidase [Cytophagales bacterium]